MLYPAVILCVTSFSLLRYIRKMNDSESRRKKELVLPLNLVAFVLCIIGIYLFYCFLDSVQY